MTGGVKVDVAATAGLASRTARSIVPVIPGSLRFNDPRHRALDIQVNQGDATHPPHTAPPLLRHSQAKGLRQPRKHGNPAAKFLRRFRSPTPAGS
jgi:hypothetical protein